MSKYKGIHYRSGLPIEVYCSDGYIQEIKEIDVQEDLRTSNLPLLAPGLVDLQVNGYGGIDLNEANLTSEQLEQLVRKLWTHGVTSFLPTVITNSPEDIGNLLQGIDNVLRTTEEIIADTITGIHLEGPFISLEDGPRGAHDKRWVQAPDLELMEKWQQQSGYRIRIVTFSPEWEKGATLARWCSNHHIIASIGHTAASGEQIERAISAGAVMSTHLGNGAHPHLPRHPNYIWDQLANDDLTACVIADGFHLSEQVLKVFYRAKAGKLILVSDSVALAGMTPGEYQAAVGGKVVLTKEGRLHLANDERLLAGSALALKHGIEKMMKLKFCSWQDVWDMASIMPAQVIGQPLLSGLKEGSNADFVLLHKHEEVLEIVHTVKQGKTVWKYTL